MLTQFLVTTLIDEAFDGTETNSSGDGAGLSLREAIGLANANGGVAGQTGEADSDTIIFDPLIAGGTITLVLGQLTIADDLEIDGADQNLADGNAGRITINGNAANRIFLIDTAGFAGTQFDVLLSNLIVTNGRVLGVVSDIGAGIWITNAESVTLTNADITNNTAVQLPAAFPVSAGGILNQGTLIITNSIISGNFADAGGGIRNSGTLTISNSAISGNSGGGISSGGTLTISNSTVSGNSGGGIGNTATLNVTDTMISGNTGGSGISNFGGSAILNVTNSSISGNLANGSVNFFGGGVSNYMGTANISNSTISGNAASRGGGIDNRGRAFVNAVVNVNNSRIFGNGAGSSGGGILNDAGQILSVDRSTLDDNTSSLLGGGLLNAGTATVTASTISNNTANGDGGGIFNVDGLDLTNSTVSGNQALTDGGGIYTRTGDVTIRNSTITKNVAGADVFEAGQGGGIFHDGAGRVLLQSTIVADNFQDNDSNSPNDIFGPINPNSRFNLIGVNNGLTGITNGTNNNQIGTLANPIDPRLGPLADNRGPTLIHGILPNSPALNKGENPLMLEFDQRGEPFVRTFGSQTDIGAYELQAQTGGGNDILVTAPGPGTPGIVQAFNAITNELIVSFQPYPGFTGGVRVAVGDVNGDEIPDIITGVGPGGGPHIKVIDGRDGITELYSFFAFAPGFSGGLYVASADLNGDDKAEIIVGADAGGGPHVIVFDVTVSTVNPLFSFFAYSSGFTGGVRVAAGDTNADGTPDIITGTGPGGGPHVKVFDGRNGTTELLSFFAYAPGFAGGIYVAAGKVNNDGNIDIITGTGPGGGPHVKVFDGRDGTTELLSFFAYAPGFTGGVRVAASDITGDGLADIITTPGPTGGPHLRAFDAASTTPDPDEIRSVLVENPGFTGGIFVAASTPLETITPMLGLAHEEGLDQLFRNGELLEELLNSSPF